MQTQKIFSSFFVFLIFLCTTSCSSNSISSSARNIAEVKNKSENEREKMTSSTFHKNRFERNSQY